MASIEETETSTVVPGVNPDAVAVAPRVWQFAPIRERNPAAPDYSNAGLDIRRHGDPLADGDAVTSLALPADDYRNGLKRSSNSNGEPTLWAEPSPQTYDTAGSVSGTVGTGSGAAGTAGNIISLGAADHTLAHPGAADFPVIVRPVASIWGARFETAQATLQALVETDLSGSVTNWVRDLSYGYGGAFSLPWPAITVTPGQTLTFTVDLQLEYRVDIAEAFAFAVAGFQVVFQITEFTSVS